MAVAVNGTSVINHAYSSPQTISKTVPAGSNQLLGVLVGYRDSAARTVSSVSFNGSTTGWTQVASAYLDVSDPGSGHAGVDLWILKAPANVTANIVVTMSAMGDTMWVCAVDFTGVDQTTPTGNVATATQVNSATATDTFTVAANNMGFGGLVCHFSGAITSLTPTQTLQGRNDDGFGGGMATGCSTGAGAISSMVWVGLLGAFSNAYAMTGVELKAAGASSFNPGIVSATKTIGGVF